MSNGREIILDKVVNDQGIVAQLGKLNQHISASGSSCCTNQFLITSMPENRARQETIRCEKEGLRFKRFTLSYK